MVDSTNTGVAHLPSARAAGSDATRSRRGWRRFQAHVTDREIREHRELP